MADRDRVLSHPHLKGGNTLILYDVSSSYLEGRCCPVAVEVFAGNASDPSTVASQVDKVRKRFGIARVALVGDRGMLTAARIREVLEPAGLDWISALRTADIHKLLKATEKTLADIAAAAARRKPGPANHDQAMRAVGREANRRKVEKHFEIAVTDDGVSWSRREERIEEEARLDGIYVIRTSLESASLGAEAAVEAYKSLASVERAFLTMKASRLRIRPGHVYSEDHVRAHVFLCMLACHVEWHMRRRLAPLLFEDDDREGARVLRSSPVEKAEVSERAKAKADAKRTPDGLPVHSMTTLLADLGTLTLNEVTLPGSPDHAFPLMAKPTELQRRAFELLDIDPAKDVAM